MPESVRQLGGRRVKEDYTVPQSHYLLLPIGELRGVSTGLCHGGSQTKKQQYTE